MTQIDIKKGHDIRISGTPSDDVVKAPKPTTVAIKPVEFRGVKAKLLVKIGDTVNIGSTLFHDKNQPSVTWGSPACGTISDIQYGPRRVVNRIIISVADKEEFEFCDAFKAQEILTLGREKVMQCIIEGNLWPLIRQRPFNKVANPVDEPRDIFISGWNTAPLSVNLDRALRTKLSPFQAGINALKQLTKGQVHLSISENSVSDTLLNADGVERHTFTGPHPAGNVGIQIHHINPIRPHDVVWTVNAQHVVMLGQYFLTGKWDPALMITVGGPGIDVPTHVFTRIGANLGTVLNGHLKEGPQRIISGDVLTGKLSSDEGYLGFYDSAIAVVPEGGDRHFLGMISPGNSHTKYSLTRTFFGVKKRTFSFNTLTNGARRAMIPLNAWEDVLPMDILPNPLYRAILAQDIEEMEQLGIYECDEEDFALCSFACPSKIDVGGVVRHGLDLMEKEG